MFRKFFLSFGAFTFFLLLIGCGVKTDSELMGLVNGAVKNCDYDDAKGYKHSYGWQIKSCKNNEIKKATEWVARKPIPIVLSTLAVVMNDKSDKKASTGVYLLNKVLWNRGIGPVGFNELADNPALLSDKAAKLFLEATRKYGQESWFQFAISSVTHIAVIKGLDAEIIALADAAKSNSYLRRDVYTNLLRYGRAKHFAKVAQFSKSKDAQEVFLSLNAARNFRDERKISEKELKEYCSLVQDFVDYEKDYIAAEAAAGLSRLCTGEFIDKSLNSIERRVNAAKGKKINGAFRFAIVYLSCPSTRVTQAQCKRKAELLKKFDALK